MLVCGDTTQNVPSEEMEKMYKQVAKKLTANCLALFDAGFSLIDAVIHGITNCVLRLAKNSTFGKTPGKIPPRTSPKGPAPSRHQAEVVRPLARTHGENVLPASEPDKTHTIIDEAGVEIQVQEWSAVYFLERHLDRIEEKKEKLKAKLRQLPLKVENV